MALRNSSRLTPKRLAAQRANAQKSTGTRAGKVRSRCGGSLNNPRQRAADAEDTSALHVLIDRETEHEIKLYLRMRRRAGRTKGEENKCKN